MQVFGKKMLFFEKNIKDTCLQKLTCFDRTCTPAEYNHVAIGCNSQKNMIKEINVCNVYGKYSILLGLVAKLSSIALQLKGKL